MRGVSSSILAGLPLVGRVLAQSCNVDTVRSDVPSNGLEVALQSYSYCGGTLNVTAYVDNLAYNKVVNLYYTNRQNESTPLTALSLSYESGVSNSNWEYWVASTPIYIDGITEFLNLTYQDTDNGQTYNEILNLPVEASGAPEPTLPSPPKPYATPLGFGDDISEFLAVIDGSQAELSHTKMFVNINPAVEGAANGTVVAAQSGPTFAQNDPDYEYNWVRDASLTMEVVEMLYSAASDSGAKSQYEAILFEYAAARTVEQNDPDLQTGLGEPKFYLNNTVFSGPWGRPQNDGPATAAITLMEFANSYLTNGGSIDTVKQKIYGSADSSTAAPVLNDLLFVASNWSYPSFDLWEEVEGDQFYTRMVQRRALVAGSDFASKMGDSQTSSSLAAAAEALTATLGQFWDPNREVLLYEYGPILGQKSSFLDIAVVLGVIHGYAADGVYSYINDRVLSTVLRIFTSFINLYPISDAKSNSDALVLAQPTGRYPEDAFNGLSTEPGTGNPWYLSSSAFAQFMYTAASTYDAAGNLSVTDTSLQFFNYFAPSAGLKTGQSYGSDSEEFSGAVDALKGWGDAFLRTIKYYTPSDGRLSEEINRDTGAPQGAADLTWSYASVLTAAFARARLNGDATYAERLANLGVVSNS